MDLLDSLDRHDPPHFGDVRERTAAIFGSTAGLAGGGAGPAAGRAGPVGKAGPAGAAGSARDTEVGGAGFGTAGEVPPSHTGAPVFGAGPLGRVRTWLFVRCGLELRTVLALAVVLAVACGLAVHHYRVGRPRTIRVPPAPVAATAFTAGAALTPARPPAAPKVTVDVAGKVAKPGLRHLPKGSRVADALAAAGGPLPGTDTTALNLARPLTDGEQILVGVTPPDAAPGAPAAPGSATAPLSLNTATEPQLDALPGVGPVLAQHIIDFRTQHGSFTSLQQLRQIPGIGPRKFATLQPLVHP